MNDAVFHLEPVRACSPFPTPSLSKHPSHVSLMQHYEALYVSYMKEIAVSEAREHLAEVFRAPSARAK